MYGVLLRSLWTLRAPRRAGGRPTSRGGRQPTQLTLLLFVLLQAAGGGVALYKYMQGSGKGNWEQVSSAAGLDLYDENEDAANKPPCWHLTIEGAQEEIRCAGVVQLA